MLDLKLQPSRTLVFLLALAHLLSIFVVWLLPLTLANHIIASLLVAASSGFYLRRDGLLAAAGSILQLRLEPDCTCTYQTRDGSFKEASLLGSSMVTPWLIVLNFSSDKRWLARHVVIFPDSADEETLRKLRVLLRWKCGNPGKA